MGARSCWKIEHKQKYACQERERVKKEAVAECTTPHLCGHALRLRNRGAEPAKRTREHDVLLPRLCNRGRSRLVHT